MRVLLNSDYVCYSFAQHWLRQLDLDFGLNYFLLTCACLNNISIKIPEFYHSCLQAWSEMLKNYNQNIHRIEEVLQQHLFGNDHIKFHKQPIQFHHWNKSGFSTVADIWNHLEISG